MADITKAPERLRSDPVAFERFERMRLVTSFCDRIISGGFSIADHQNIRIYELGDIRKFEDRNGGLHIHILKDNSRSVYSKSLLLRLLRKPADVVAELYTRSDSIVNWEMKIPYIDTKTFLKMTGLAKDLASEHSINIRVRESPFAAKERRWRRTELLDGLYR